MFSNWKIQCRIAILLNLMKVKFCINEDLQMVERSSSYPIVYSSMARMKMMCAGCRHASVIFIYYTNNDI